MAAIIHVNVRQDVTKKQILNALERAIGPIDFFVEIDRLGLCTIECYSQSDELVADIRQVVNGFRRAIYESSVNTRGIIGARLILDGLAENWPEQVYVIPGVNQGVLIVGSDDQSGVDYVVREFACQCGI